MRDRPPWGAGHYRQELSKAGPPEGRVSEVVLGGCLRVSDERLRDSVSPEPTAPLRAPGP